MLRELGIAGLPAHRFNEASILTLMHHKVADRFYPLLRRYEAANDAKGSGWLRRYVSVSTIRA